MGTWTLFEMCSDGIRLVFKPSGPMEQPVEEVSAAVITTACDEKITIARPGICE
jgi:hypothetical protein